MTDRNGHADPANAAAQALAPRWWTPLALAVAFLTVLPSPPAPATPPHLARAIGLFPAVGVALDRLLPAGPTAALLLVASALLTGGLHLDGLMDTADGVFGGRDRERRLAIMRDSRVGAFGAIAGVLALLTQFACLAELRGLPRLTALAVALALGRWTMAFALARFPPARPDGLGAAFRAAGGRGPLLIASLIALAVALVGGGRGLAAFVTAAIVALVNGRFLAGRLGGLTGDTYGALAVVAETGSLCVAVAVSPR